MSQLTLQQGKELGVALLADSSSSPRVTEQLVSLVTTTPSSSPTPLALYSAIHSILFPLVSATPPSVSHVASYFSDSLFPALRAAEDSAEDPAQRVADVIIDAVWQIDQEIENGMLYFHSAASASAAAVVVPVEEQMDVDGVAGSKEAGAGEAEATASAESAAAKEVLRQQQNKKQEKEGRTRLAELVKLLITANILSTSACLERLETAFVALPPLALITDQSAFARLEIRSRTAFYYKQQKFNLVREESEGYSKLLVELLSNMGPPHSVTDARSQESESQRVRRAKLVGDSVKSLIGNFNLDPDRALDIILDAFSDQVVQHHQFFVDFLAHSPWAPKKPSSSSAKTGADMEVDEAEGGKGKAKAKEPLVDVGLETDKGSFLIGQILGFKFSFYQGTATSEETPEKLYLMTALLILNGFVKLGDLYPHLSPDDDVLAKTEAVYRDAQAQLTRAVGGSNALAQAGALVDDDAPSRPSSSTNSKAAADAAAASAKRDLPHQKLGLLRALLSIGDLEHSLFILAQYPFLVPAYPDLADLLLRLLDESIAPAYATISVAKEKGQYSHDFTAAKPKFVPASTAASKVAPVTPVNTYLSGRAFPDPNKEYVFFFADWKERLPKAGDWEEVLEVLELYLPFVGVFVSRNFSLYTKLCRIISRDIRDKHNDRMNRWIDLIRQFLLPAISLLEHHTVAAIEIWTVLEGLSLEQRFTLYGEWKDTMYRRIPALTVRKAEAERDVKNVLRRLSTDNVKKLGKTLAKIAHTNPAIIFAIALNQVQSYDNLIVPVVEAARYLSEFGYDVMTFSLLDALSSGRAKTKEDGTSVAMWLQGLASFAGQLYRRWAAMSGSMWVILQYLVNQLVSGSSKDLVILREFITRMTGLEPFADLSDAQVMSLAGGRVLRSEVFNQTDISQASKRAQVVSLQNAKIRLTDALRRSGLAMPLLVNIAIQRQACLSDTEAHLKSLGGLFDQCHAVLFQYIEFLRSAYEPDDLAAEVPTISDLMERWGIEAAVAFDIARPKLRAAMKIYEKDINEQDKAAEAKRKAGLAAKLAQEKAIAAGSAKVEEVKVEDASASNGNGDIVMADAAPVTAAPQAPAPVWHPGLLDVIKTADVVLPEGARLLMGSPFFVTFWQLTLYDIVYPKERYDSELVRCSAMSREANSSLTLKADDKKKFSDEVGVLAKKLTDEFGEHGVARTVTQRRLTREKGQWFAANVRTAEERERLVLQIVQHCIHPRAKLSLPDAAFSYQFIKRMHAMDTPAFRTVIVFEQILSEQLGPVLYSCTENEARNYARFLFDMLADLHSWYKTESSYKLEAISSQTHGFLEFDQATTSSSSETAYITWDKYKILMQKWQNGMVRTFSLNLESGEYMHIKNSILVLTKIAPYFPLQHSAGVQLEKSVAALIAAEKREDLKILASGYKAVLYKQRKQWIDQPVFEEPKPRAVPAPAPVPARAPASTTTAPSTPSRRPSPVAVSATASASTSNSAAVPTGPKFGLPAKPGAANGSTSRPPAVSRPSENDSKVVAMDVDKPSSAPAPTSSTDSRPHAAEPLRRPAELNGNSRPVSTSSRDAPSASSFRTHSSLPQRPGQQSSSTSIAPEALRQQALASQGASKRTAAAMDPPAAPSTSARRDPVLPSTKRDSPPPSTSRPVSPRYSDSGRRDRSSRDGDSRGDRSGKASRDRSPTPARRTEKDKYESKERPREDDHRRTSHDDRSRDPRSGRDDRRDKDGTRTKERDDRGDDRSRPARGPPRGPTKDDDRRSVDSRRREPESDRRTSSSSRAPEKAESSRSDGREGDREKDFRARRDPSPARRSDADSQRRSQSRPQASADRAAPPPADIKAERPDRLRPAPAHATSASTAAPESAISIKGRGGGNIGRIFTSAFGAGGRNPARKSSGSSSRPREDSRQDEREEESKKRPSSSGGLLDRLKPGTRDDGQDAKRPRTGDADEGSKDPPPHVRGTSEARGQDQRGGEYRGTGGGRGHPPKR